MPDIFDRFTAPLEARRAAPDPAFAAAPRLRALRSALARAARRRAGRWNEPPVFFFDPKRQAELEAARPAAPDPYAELTALVAAELPVLLGAIEVRRAARALGGLTRAARELAPRCPAAKALADLLAVPDDEVFLALAPAAGTGVRVHLRGAAEVAHLYRSLAGPSFPGAFQLFAPAALRPDGTLPTGFGGSAHWLWPTQPLAAVPRVGGERVVLVGPAVVRPVLDVEPRFPALVPECEPVQTLDARQTADELARLCGRPVRPVEAPAVARAA